MSEAIAMVPVAAAADLALKGQALRVLVAICGYADAEHRVSVSMQAISELTELPLRDVQREVARLKRRGHLRRTGERSDGQPTYEVMADGGRAP